MSVKFEKVTAGDTYYDCHRRRMGNTTMSKMGVWPIRVISVDHAAGFAMCSWNSNAATKYTAFRFAKLRRHPPEWVNGYCYECGASKQEGHFKECTHPRAVAARKRAAKEPEPRP